MQRLEGLLRCIPSYPSFIQELYNMAYVASLEFSNSEREEENSKGDATGYAI